MTKYHPETGEPSNAQRAEWATSGLDAFAKETYGGRAFKDLPADSDDPSWGDDFCCAQDLICNILHVAVERGWDIDILLAKARGCHEEEQLMEREPGIPPETAQRLYDGSLPTWTPTRSIDPGDSGTSDQKD